MDTSKIKFMRREREVNTSLVKGGMISQVMGVLRSPKHFIHWFKQNFWSANLIIWTELFRRHKALIVKCRTELCIERSSGFFFIVLKSQW